MSDQSIDQPDNADEQHYSTMLRTYTVRRVDQIVSFPYASNGPRQARTLAQDQSKSLGTRQ